MSTTNVVYAHTPSSRETPLAPLAPCHRCRMLVHSPRSWSILPERELGVLRLDEERRYRWTRLRMPGKTSTMNPSSVTTSNFKVETNSRV